MKLDDARTRMSMSLRLISLDDSVDVSTVQSK